MLGNELGIDVETDTMLTTGNDVYKVPMQHHSCNRFQCRRLLHSHSNSNSCIKRNFSVMCELLLLLVNEDETVAFIRGLYSNPIETP